MRILSLCSFLFLSASISNKAFTPRASFDRLWTDFDVFDIGIKGMKVHVKFTACETSDNSTYRSRTWRLAVNKLITPAYDQADYNDMSFFIPYSEFNLSSGRTDLKIDANLIYKEGGRIQHLKYYDFWINK